MSDARMARRVLRAAVIALACAALAAPLAFAEETPEAPPPDASAPDNSAPEEKRAPITSASGTAPAETLQQRMERFKREKGAGSDKPFEGFATEAERAMQREREAAVGGAVDGVRTDEERKQWSTNIEDRTLEEEMLEDRLAELSPQWGASGCYFQEPDWNSQDDFIKHRKLTRNDFLSEKEEKVKLAVHVPNSQTGAYVSLIFSCVAQAQATPLEDGRHRAEVTHVRYFALLSRAESFWSPISDDQLAYVLGHEQLHFDIAEAFAKHLSSVSDKIRAAHRTVGRSPEEAMGRLQLEWGQHMKLVQEDFRRLETAYDRETKHGTVLDLQTAWVWRNQDGFAAISRGVKLESLKRLR